MPVMGVSKVQLVKEYVQCGNKLLIESLDLSYSNFIQQKATLCVLVAVNTLPEGASESMIENQAFSYMHLSNEEVISLGRRSATTHTHAEYFNRLLMDRLNQLGTV